MSDEKSNTEETSNEDEKTATGATKETIEGVVNNLTGQLKEWGIDINQFQEKMVETGADAQETFNKLIEDAQTRIDSTQSKLKNEQQREDKAAYEVLKGFRSAWGEIRNGFASAASKYNTEGKKAESSDDSSEE